jgi:hypothetical protein
MMTLRSGVADSNHLETTKCSTDNFLVTIYECMYDHHHWKRNYVIIMWSRK